MSQITASALPPAHPIPCPPITGSTPSLFTITTFQQTDPSDPTSPPKTVYTLRPQAIWDSLSRMREVIVDDESYLHNHRVYLNPSSLDSTTITASTSTTPLSPLRSNVVGHILEIRAKDARHVYLRVYLMRPAKKGGGRGKSSKSLREREWVTTDEMVVVNAAAVLGKACIEYVEEDEGGEGGKGSWMERVDVDE